MDEAICCSTDLSKICNACFSSQHSLEPFRKRAVAFTVKVPDGPSRALPVHVLLSCVL